MKHIGLRHALTYAQWLWQSVCCFGHVDVTSTDAQFGQVIIDPFVLKGVHVRGKASLLQRRFGLRLQRASACRT